MSNKAANIDVGGTGRVRNRTNGREESGDRGDIFNVGFMQLEQTVPT